MQQQSLELCKGRPAIIKVCYRQADSQLLLHVRAQLAVYIPHFGAGAQVKLQERLQRRIKCSTTEFAEAMAMHEQNFQAADYCPVSSVTSMLPGTYHLTHVDQNWRSNYARV